MPCFILLVTDGKVLCSEVRAYIKTQLNIDIFLHLVGFLQTQAQLDDLEEILNLLPANDVLELTKSMHIITKGKNKKQLVNALLQQSKTQCSLFSNNGNRTQKEIVKRLVNCPKSLCRALVQYNLISQLLCL